MVEKLNLRDLRDYQAEDLVDLQDHIIDTIGKKVNELVEASNRGSKEK